MNWVRTGVGDPPYWSREVAFEDVSHTGCGEVHRYWDVLRGGRLAPAWEELDLLSLPADIIPHVRVVDVIDGGADFHYRYWGTGLVDVCNGERSGQSLFEKTNPRREVAISEYRRVVDTRAPYYYVYNANWRDHQADLHAPAARFPLSSDGESVDKVLSYVDFRQDRASWKRFFETTPL
jgi:hypothetical protein